MVSKDQGIGGAILGVCIIVILGYLVLIGFPGLLGFHDGDKVRLYAVTVLVSIAFIAVLVIGAWIGWTMATTPPPKPIEEITTEIEEKKEETPKTEEAAQPTEAPATEDKTAKKKK
jgi:hypothetical protein